MKKKLHLTEAEIAETLLALFDADTYRGAPFSLPGESQIGLMDLPLSAPTAYGNLSCTLPTALSLQQRTGIVPKGSAAKRAWDNAIENRWFSLVCGKTDPVAAAAKAMLTLMQQKQIHRFVVLVRGMVERDATSLSLPVYLDRIPLPTGKPTVQVFSPEESDRAEEGLSMLRRYVCEPMPQILLMNREYYNRPGNLLLRPMRQLDGLSPVTLLQMAHPVVITIGETADALCSLLRSSTLLQPLCALSFVTSPDTTGTTLPICKPGMLSDKPDQSQQPQQQQLPEGPEQMQM